MSPIRCSTTAGTLMSRQLMPLSNAILSFTVVLCIGTNARAADATFHVSGNLNVDAPIALPPPAPTTFRELTDSAFYSFSSVVGTREADNQELAVSFYAWKTAERTVSVRAYLDGKYVGGKPGVPALVGRGRLAFSKTGSPDFSRALPAASATGYLLDQDPVSDSPTITLSITWAGKPTEQIAVSFDDVSLTPSPSAITSVAK